MVTELRVMTFNMWLGGSGGGLPLERSADVIRSARADVVGVQETSLFPPGHHPDSARAVAEILGWNYVEQGGNRGILSRYEIAEQTPERWGARIETPGGPGVWLFNAHFAHAPYQPYQLLGIPYADAPFLTTAAEVIMSAQIARSGQVAAMIAEIEAVSTPDAVVFVTGDFNEPSSLDWTDEVANTGRCPVAVQWPTTGAMFTAGFSDTYRLCHPSPVRSPGCTWSTRTCADDPGDHHDRIDFVMVRGKGVTVTTSEVVGEQPGPADIVVSPYPSDHRAVVTTVHLSAS